MAFIKQRGKTYYVVYKYLDKEGRSRQKWEAFPSKSAAERRLKEVDYKKAVGTLVIPECRKLDDLLQEYVESHGKERWSVSTYQANLGLIRNYISPYIGRMNISDINTRVIETYYRKLQALPPECTGCRCGHITPSMIRDIHKLLKSCFKMAVKWELLERNPAEYAEVPKYHPKERDIWTAEELFHAIDVCDDDGLKLCMNLAFACTMRISEILGLTWDCIDITDEAVKEDRAYLYINKQIQRVNRSALEALDDKDVIKKFVPADEHAKSIIVLKTPKTQSSIRKVFLPKTVAGMLSEWKAKQEELREILGSEYEDNNLVICSEYGGPVEENAIKKKFDKLIRENGLRKVVFHSIRHTSITYKLRLTGGDVKAVQGDSGHAQTSMVTDVYSHILDENRIRNAEEVEAAFYSGKAPEHKKKTIPAVTEDNMKVIANLLQNKELMAVIKTMMG